MTTITLISNMVGVTPENILNINPRYPYYNRIGLVYWFSQRKSNITVPHVFISQTITNQTSHTQKIETSIEI